MGEQMSNERIYERIYERIQINIYNERIMSINMGENERITYKKKKNQNIT